MSALSDAIGDAKEGLSEMKSWLHTMLEDFKLLPRKPMWGEAIMKMCEFAAGLTVNADEPKPTVPPVADEVSHVTTMSPPHT